MVDLSGRGKTVVGAGTEKDIHHLPLFTRKRRRIENIQRLELPDAMLKEARVDLERDFPDAQYRTISNTYNCVGLVFASRRTAIDTSQLRLILEDDGFRQLRSEFQAKAGDLILYRYQGEYAHVGIVTCTFLDLSGPILRLNALSKWGDWGEYIHPAHKVPTQFGVPSEYWTDRRGDL